jgi:hypothetical protein
MKTLTLSAAIALSVASPAYAGDYLAKPIAGAADVLTYDKGVPILTRETASAIITVLSVEAYYGRPSFVVEVFNKGAAPFNFGTENILADVAGAKKPMVVYTRKELEAQAQNRAAWAAVGAALVAASAGYSSYSSTTHTPYGSYRTRGSYYNSFAAQMQAQRAGEAISAGLGERIADAKANSLQTTTVQPGEGYGGRIVLSKPSAKFPAPLTLTIMGEAFAFEVTK